MRAPQMPGAGWHHHELVNVQALLHRAADTDLRAQLAYQERVEAFHTRLRQYFYPFIFNDRPFGPQEFAALPAYAGDAHEAR